MNHFTLYHCFKFCMKCEIYFKISVLFWNIAWPWNYHWLCVIRKMLYFFMLQIYDWTCPYFIFKSSFYFFLPYSAFLSVWSWNTLPLFLQIVYFSIECSQNCNWLCDSALEWHRKRFLNNGAFHMKGKSQVIDFIYFWLFCSDWGTKQWCQIDHCSYYASFIRNKNEKTNLTSYHFFHPYVSHCETGNFFFNRRYLRLEKLK